jgi:hypothetical protein
MSTATQPSTPTGTAVRNRRGSATATLVLLAMVAVVLTACTTPAGGGTSGLSAATPSAASTPILSQSAPGSAAATPPVKAPSAPATPSPDGPSTPAVALAAHVGTPTVKDASLTSPHCPVTVGYAATITVNTGPVTVAYVWHDSTGTATTGHVTFPLTGAQHAVVHHKLAITTTQLDTPTHGWANIALTSPHSGATANTSVVLRCEPAVTSFAVTAPPFGHCGGAYTAVAAVVTVPFGDTAVHYTMDWGDGSSVFSGTQTFGAGGAQHATIGLHHIYAVGDWTMKLSLTEGASSGGKRMLCSGSAP